MTLEWLQEAGVGVGSKEFFSLCIKKNSALSDRMKWKTLFRTQDMAMDGLSKAQIWEAIRYAIRSSSTVTSRNLQAQYQMFKMVSAMKTTPPETPQQVDVHLALEPEKNTLLKEMDSATKEVDNPELVEIYLALEEEKGAILRDKA